MRFSEEKLFEEKEKRITIPEKKFDDFLGRGLSGSIYGMRSRVKKFNIGKIESVYIRR